MRSDWCQWPVTAVALFPSDEEDSQLGDQPGSNRNISDRPLLLLVYIVNTQTRMPSSTTACQLQANERIGLVWADRIGCSLAKTGGGLC